MKQPCHRLLFAQSSPIHAFHPQQHQNSGSSIIAARRFVTEPPANGHRKGRAAVCDLASTAGAQPLPRALRQRRERDFNLASPALLISRVRGDLARSRRGGLGWILARASLDAASGSRLPTTVSLQSVQLSTLASHSTNKHTTGASLHRHESLKWA